MTCSICLEDCYKQRYSNSCSCKFIVCDQCWSKTWSCLYCRKPFERHFTVRIAEIVSFMLRAGLYIAVTYCLVVFTFLVIAITFCSDDCF